MTLSGVKQYFASTPGKVIITGEHAAVYGKAVIAASVDLHMYVYSKEIEPKKILVNFMDIGFEFECPTECLFALKPAGKSEIGHPGEIEELAKSLETKGLIKIPENTAMASALYVVLFLYSSLIPVEKRDRGLEISIRSTIPIGAGLGSSAAYASSLTAIMLQASGVVDKATVDSEEFLQKVNAWAFKAEQVVHGTPSGVDNTVVTFGGFVKFEKDKSIVNITNNNTDNGGLELEFLIVDTKVPKNTKAMVAGVRKRYDAARTETEALLNQIHGISNKLFSILEYAQEPKSTPGVNKPLGDKLEGVDLDNLESAISKCIDENHLVLEKLGVSHPVLEQVKSIANSFGFASKLTGGGGGGCALVFISKHGNKAETEENRELVISSLESKGFKCYPAFLGVKGVRTISELEFLRKDSNISKFVTKDNKSSGNDTFGVWFKSCDISDLSSLSNML